MTEQLIVKPIEILTAEDNPADMVYLMESFKELGVANQISTVPDGEACLAWLRREGEYRDGCRPDLVFLDTRMPKLDGYEVFVEMKRDAALRDIPVVVLTGSRMETEALKYEGLHPDCYIEKPLDPVHLHKAFQCFKEFAFYVVPRETMASAPTPPASS